MLQLKIQNLDELIDWLALNYDSKESIWLVFPKKSAGSNFAWSEIVDVLLCYGWIDSLPRKIDEKYTSIRISPRNPKSNWSKINKDKVKILSTKGLIHPNGQKLIDLAKLNGNWTALDDVENLILPKDLDEFLTQNNLVQNWHTKGKTFKKGVLQKLLDTKSLENRNKIIGGLKL